MAPSYDKVIGNITEKSKTFRKAKRQSKNIVNPPLPPAPSTRFYLFPGYRIAFLNDLGPINSDYHFANGFHKIYYKNGAVKTVGKHGVSVVNLKGIHYTIYRNGDMLQVFPDGATAYKHTHGPLELQLPNGHSIVEFRDGRREYRTNTGEVYVQLRNGKKIALKQTGSMRVHKPIHLC
jgi:hypothetical protein